MDKEIIKQLKDDFYGPHDFVQTSPCGRGQHHIHGLVGKLWRVVSPETIRVGNCFMAGRIKKDDLWLGIAHSGDCFQTYMYVEEYVNCLIGKPELTFGSYGIGDSIEVGLENGKFGKLKAGEVIKGGGKREKGAGLHERKPQRLLGWGVER